MPSQDDDVQIWFLTGSQALYGEETLRQVEDQSRRIAETLAAQLGVRLVWRPVLTTADAIRRACLDATASDECIGVVAWMHTFSPAKMWISGLEELRKPLLHLHTQANVSLPWSQIDMDFMNLNQAAHGDREFGYIQTRLGVARKIVAGDVSDPVVAARVEAWTRAARGWQAAQSLRMAWVGGIMRNVAVTEGDKVEAERVFGFSVNTWGVTTSWPPWTPFRTPRSTRSPRSTTTATRWCPSCGLAGSDASRCATPPGRSWGCGPSSTTVASAPSPRTSRTSAACASCPASPSSASWPTATGSPARGTGRRRRSWGCSR